MKKTIKQIEELLFHSDRKLTENELQLIQQDSRVGVQKLWKKRCVELNTQAELMRKYKAMSLYENDLREEGVRIIAGVDEVGRGPLAGPVIAAAVILEPTYSLLGLNDSKALTEIKREELYQKIMESAISIGIGMVAPKEIDELNIYHASKQAMLKAVKALKQAPDHLLIDALEIPVSIPQTAIIKGDAKSVSIAAASIVAKVTRDRLMKKLSVQHPQYGFARNMGYGTKEHLIALKTFGVTDEHRRSFSPVAERLKSM
jgi:ribonuclease HII